MLSIRYLYHSGFMVELDRHILVFDYYPGAGRNPCGALEDGLLDPSSFPAGKETIFFISHAHRDHYTSQVLEWCQSNPRLSAVVSFDVPCKEPGPPVLVMQPHETAEWHGLNIQTLRSTDEGVAFLVRAEGLVFYHAGDLNWWHWFGEAQEENRDMAAAYQEEIRCLDGVSIDYAFLVLDPRLESAYDWGVRSFLETAEVSFWLPMHFGDDPQCVDWLKQDLQAQTLSARMIALTRRGEVWQLLKERRFRAGFSGVHLRNMTALYVVDPDRQEILMLYRTGSRVGEPNWRGVGGHFEEAELNDPDQCILREFEEETGLDFSLLSCPALRYISLNCVNDEIRQNYYYFAEAAKDALTLNSCAEGTLRWVPFKEAGSLPQPFTAGFMLRHYLAEGRHNHLLYGAIGHDQTVSFYPMNDR